MGDVGVAILEGLNPVRWTGPILEKELRVISRRKRYYWQRVAYTILLLLFIGFSYGSIVMANRVQAPMAAAQVSEMGKQITGTVVWIQFVVVQLFAITHLSGAVSGEITQRTLGVLLTTPISSLQIVIGKLLAALAQAFLLMALSLPILAVVRVMGGVPWLYLVESTCVTVTSMLFVAALTFAYAVRARKPQRTLGFVFITLGIFYVIVPFIVQVLTFRFFFTGNQGPQNAGFLAELATNLSPPLTIVSLGFKHMAGVNALGGSWYVHCGIMLGIAAVLLILAILQVRPAALRALTGAVTPRSRRVRARGTSNVPGVVTASRVPARKVKRVTGAPIVWQEKLHHELKLSAWVFAAARVLLIIAIAATYLISIEYEWPAHGEWHSVLMTLGLQYAMLYVAFRGAGAIIREREARTLPALFTTPLTNRQIVCGKAWAIIRPVLWILILMVVHVLLFTMLGLAHPLALLYTILTTAAGVSFALFFSLYISSRCRRRTSAYLWVAVVVGGLVLPAWCCCSPLGIISPTSYLQMALWSSCGERPNIYSMSRQPLPIPFLTMEILIGLLFIVPVIYGLVAILFARMSCRRLRKGMFAQAGT